MSSIDRLLTNYTRQVSLPWSANVAGKQRVWFAVYPPSDERKVRARMPQFEATTLEAGHGWSVVDLTGLLPQWLAGHDYREEFFRSPEYFTSNDELEILAADRVSAECGREESDSKSVVVIAGLASLFDYMRVSSLIDRVEDNIRGRLLVLFPGEYRQNVYRFMDARDGFNYMAVPITSAENFINP